MFIRIYHVKKRSKYNILETANRDFNEFKIRQKRIDRHGRYCRFVS